MVNSEIVLGLLNYLDNKENCKKYFLGNIANDEKAFEIFFNEVLKAKDCKEKDLQFFLESDPAADSLEEIKIAYPGYKAILYHRIAHALYLADQKVAARILAENAHVFTGIDIHPGAQIGCPFFIDHGTGTVIGETAVIGDRCKIYQGVTLGALSLSEGYKLKGKKRHPTIGNDVIIYSGASILGGDVVIGDRTIIGSSVFLIESIPSDHKVVLSKPELSIIKKQK